MILTSNEIEALRSIQKKCHEASVKGGWWHDPITGEKLVRNKGELLCLMHSEISEAMEAVRKDAMDDKLPHRKGAEVELGDAMIREMDFAESEGYDLAAAIEEKLQYNANRADHKPENRIKQGGKAF